MNFTAPEIAENNGVLTLKYKWFSQQRWHTLITAMILLGLFLIGPLTLEDCPLWFRIFNGLLFLLALRGLYIFMAYSINRTTLTVDSKNITGKASPLFCRGAKFNLEIDKIETIYLSHFKDDAKRTIHGVKEDKRQYECEFLHDKYIYFLLKDKTVSKMKVFNEEQNFQPFLAGLLVDFIWNKADFEIV